MLKEYPRDRFVALTLDLGVRSTIDKLAETITDLLPDGLDYLINNAAVCSQKLTPFEKLLVGSTQPVFLVITSCTAGIRTSSKKSCASTRSHRCTSSRSFCP